MENHTHSRRHHPAGIPLSPLLLRSKSGTPAISLPEIHSFTSNSVHRSKSTTKSRTNVNGENSINPSKAKKPQEFRDGFVKFWQHSATTTGEVAKRTRPTPKSPSAWALSPGRSPPCSPSPKTSGSGRLGGGGGGGVSGVLKYFRQKKPSAVQEVEYRRFRVIHNGLSQWRFVNARAQASMAAVSILAEKKIFNVWVRILAMRNSVAEKQIRMQRLKHEIKLHQIMNSQACLLKEWRRLESRNYDAVGRVATKLSATSIRLPLVHAAKGDVEAVYDAMRTATGVMDNFEEAIMKFHSQVEKTCYLLTELTIIEKQQKKYLEELDKRMATIASLKAEEKSLRVHLIQMGQQ